MPGGKYGREGGKFLEGSQIPINVNDCVKFSNWNSEEAEQLKANTFTSPCRLYTHAIRWKSQSGKHSTHTHICNLIANVRQSQKDSARHKFSISHLCQLFPIICNSEILKNYQQITHTLRTLNLVSHVL